MSKADTAIIAAVSEIDKEIERLTKIKKTLQGKEPTAETEPEKRRHRRTRKYAFQIKEVITTIFDDNPNRFIDTKIAIKETKKFTPNVNPNSVLATLSILRKEGYLERSGRGQYIKRTN